MDVQTCLSRSPHGGFETWQVGEQTRTCHQMAALAYGKPGSRHAQATTLGLDTHLEMPGHNLQVKPLPHFAAREHGCWVQGDTEERICGSHGSGLTQTSAGRGPHSEGWGTKVPVPTHVLLEHCRHGKRHTHADLGWRWEVVCVPTGDNRQFGDTA